MRIALVLPHDHPDGVFVWAKNIHAGMTSLRHHVLTLSSKRLKSNLGEHFKSNVAEHILQELDRFNPDLIIFQCIYDEPKVVAKFPMWKEVIRSLKHLWTFAFQEQASSYDSPHGQDTLFRAYSQRNFIGAVICVADQPARLVEDRGVVRIPSLLPFFTTDSYRRDDIYTKRVVSLSLASKVKQWSLLFRAAVVADSRHVPVKKFVFVGNCPSSPGVAATNAMMIRLMKDHNMFVPLSVRELVTSNVHKANSWYGVLSNETRVEFVAGYDRDKDNYPFTPSDLFLNTTMRHGGSHGPIEYTTLEAIDNGLDVLVPVENGDNRYCHLDARVYSHEKYNSSRTTPAIMQGAFDKIAIDMIIRNVESFGTSTHASRKNQRAARSAILSEQHDPALVAYKLLDNLKAAMQ